MRKTLPWILILIGLYVWFNKSNPLSPAPIPHLGYRVLIVYETADLGKLPKEQLAAMNSLVLITYLDSKCVKGPDGKTPEYRFLDYDTPMQGESKLWQEAMEKIKKNPIKSPQIIVSNGRTGYIGDFPKNLDELLVLLKRYE